MRTLAIGALGGTIAMTPGTDGSIVPTLSAEQLAAAVPGLADLADLRVETLATLPSPSLDEPTVLRALAWARAQVAAGTAGAVITQGTDTLEESAYLLDLHWDRPEPLVVTGAMRAPTSPGADGPANLSAAARTALAPSARDRGVLVVVDDEIHAAHSVAKTDSLATGAFRSPAFGPVGRHVEGAAVFAVPAPARPVPFPPPSPDAGIPRVPLLWTYLGDDGHLARSLALAGPDRIDGLVVAGFGAGHVSPAMADALGDLAAQTPVVFATRTGAGPTGRAIYGYPGSEVDLQARGLVGAGWLTPLKARLLLAALTRAGRASRDEVAAAFAIHGAP